MTESNPKLVTREDFVREAARLRESGMLVREIAAHFGVARSTAGCWLTDPDLSKQRACRERYRGTCEKCGAATDGSNGKAKAPRVCASCYIQVNRAAHGTRSRYNAGCRCDDCRAANRDRTRSLKGTEPPNHGASGYSNYGCRCDVCRKGNADYLWLTGHEYQRRWQHALPCGNCGGARIRGKKNKSGLCRVCWVEAQRAKAAA